MRCVVVNVQYWESVINMLDDIWEIGVLISVHIVYDYDGYCCVFHVENMAIFYLKKWFSLYVILSVNQILKFHGFLR